MDIQEKQKGRAAIRFSYDYGQTLADSIADAYPAGEKIDTREEIRWCLEQISDDPRERAELLPYAVYGFRQGTVDMLYEGEDRYHIDN